MYKACLFHRNRDNARYPRVRCDSDAALRRLRPAAATRFGAPLRSGRRDTQSASTYCDPRGHGVTADSDCVLFAWDWREGMVAAAHELDDLIERLRRLRGDPSLRVDIVVHSAGGLVTRYFVRFGGVDTLHEVEPPITFAGGQSEELNPD